MKQHLPIGALILVFLALAALYSFVVPVGEGPDEPGHTAYVFFLARERSLPAPGDVLGEGHQPPLAYILVAPAVAWLPLEQRQIDLPGNPRFTWAGGDELNAVAHGSREYLPWRGAVLAWHLARLVSAALGAATVLCTYAAALELDARWARMPRGGRSFVALLAAALVAFNPQFLFISALVTNDALLTALSAAMLWLVVSEGRQPAPDDRRLSDLRKWRLGRPVAIGLVLGLALLTKQSALLLAPVALLGVIAWDGKEAQATSRERIILSSCHLVILSRAAIMLGTTALVAGWWYVRNWRLYGDPLGLSAFRAEFMTQPFEIGSLAAWGGALAQLHDSFWARFGWMNVLAPSWIMWAVVIVELAGLAGWLRALWSTNRQGLIDRNTWPLIALPLLGFGWIVSFAVMAGLVAWQGRLLFPALPAIAILLACGLAAWQNREPRTENLPPTRRGGEGERGRRGEGPISNLRSPIPNLQRREGERGRGGERPISNPSTRLRAGLRSPITGLWLLGGLWLLAVAWLPFGVIRPAYPFHTLPENVALTQAGTPAYGRFGKAGERGAELRGWRMEGTSRPGTAPEVVLTWHALARQNRDWVVFIHLVGEDDQIEAEDNRQPQDGVFPMTQWVAGDWIVDRHPLPLPADLAPGVYTLRVGLYDPGTDERTGVYDQSEKLTGDYLDVGRIVIE